MVFNLDERAGARLMSIRQKTQKEMITTLRKYGAMKCRYDLREANLREADLREANLREADLREADLRDADLWEADLREADLREADLRDADLQGTKLQGTKLQGTKLQGAKLQGANLWVFQTTQFRAIYIPWQHLLKIGCLEYPIAYWVAHYEAIGKDHDFSEQEISQYGAFIKLCAEVLD